MIGFFFLTFFFREGSSLLPLVLLLVGRPEDSGPGERTTHNNMIRLKKVPPPTTTPTPPGTRTTSMQIFINYGKTITSTSVADTLDTVKSGARQEGIPTSSLILKGTARGAAPCRTTAPSDESTLHLVSARAEAYIPQHWFLCLNKHELTISDCQQDPRILDGLQRREWFQRHNEIRHFSCKSQHRTRKVFRRTYMQKHTKDGVEHESEPVDMYCPNT